MLSIVRRAIRWCVDQADTSSGDNKRVEYCYFYLPQYTIRGFLLGHSRAGYIVERAEVAAEGSATFRQLKERVVIPHVEFYTTDTPSASAR